MGARGLETDAWLSADGVVVLAHDGRVGRRPFRRQIGHLARADLPASLCSLDDLYEACGTAFELSVDVKDPGAAAAVVAAARAAHPGAPKRLWLCHPDLGVLGGWRKQFPDVHLVNSTSVRRVAEGLEQRAAALSRSGVDAFNAHHTEWTGGHVALFHRFDRMAFAWDAQHERVLQGLLEMGVDGVYSDHVDRLVGALRARFGTG